MTEPVSTIFKTTDIAVDRRKAMEIVDCLREIGGVALFLVSDTDSQGEKRYTWVAYTDESQIPGQNPEQNVISFYQTEHNPQNGRSVLIALNLTESIDTQWPLKRGDLPLSGLEQEPLTPFEKPKEVTPIQGANQTLPDGVKRLTETGILELLTPGQPATPNEMRLMQ